MNVNPKKKELNQISIVQTFKGLVILARPADGVIIGGTVILGMIIGLHKLPNALQMTLGLIGGILLLGGMDTFNDYLDLEMDSISKPWRPLPQGLVSPTIALLAALIETLLGLTIGIILFNSQVIIVGLIAIILAVVYSKKLKPYFLAKNLIVAFSLSLAFLGGVLAVNTNPQFNLHFVLIQLLTFLAALNFEIHKDLGDISGDSRYDVKTIPSIFGRKITEKVVIVGYSLCWIIASLFVLLYDFDLIYLLILIFAFLFLITVFFLLIKDSEKHMELTRRMTNLTMAFILLGLARISLISLN